MEDKIRQYLKNPRKYPRPQGEEDPQFAFLITYLGELFIQGYRLIQNYGQFLLFCIMEFQFSQGSVSKAARSVRKLPARFKLVCWQMSSKHISDSGKQRRELYGRMLQIGGLLQQLQYNIIYLREFRYSVLGQGCLQKNSVPQCEQYFRKIQWIEQKNGYRPIMQKQQGIQMHRLVQSFIKGAGEARNAHLMHKIQGQNKFVYDLFKVINTVCYIIGRQILENDYQTMSVEKWMRKFTEKKFKRFDLLMRSERKCSIIDWKFTRLDAEEKIKGAQTQRKNEIYYQLARKDFKTDIELKFYCFHEKVANHSYHYFTCANFDYKIKTVEIEEEQKKEAGQKNEKEDRKKNESEDFGITEILVEDYIVDQIADAPGQSVQQKVLSKEERFIIALDSDCQIQEQHKKTADSSVSHKQSCRSMSQCVSSQQSDFSQLQRELVTNKRKLKSQKLKSKGLGYMPEVYQILSD